MSHLPYSFSNHCPILIDIEGANFQRHGFDKRIFCFNAEWCSEADCKNVIKSFWVIDSNELPRKLEILGKRLLWWSSSVRKSRRLIKATLNRRLQLIHEEDPTDENLSWRL